MSASLDFLGGTGTVTGSRFLISMGDDRLLVDCGLFQGLRELRTRNWEPFPVAPASIGATVVTHAHLDHSGYLPALVRDGFAGPIHLTPGTGALAAIVLRDSAHLLMEDTEHAKRHGYSKHSQPRPLYTDADVDDARALFNPVRYDVETALPGSATVTLRPAGHILGSSNATVRLPSGRAVLFSGDVGRPSHPLLRAPGPPSAANVIVVESTYGDRRHADNEGDELLAAAVSRTVKRGGSVVIPAFAVDRTEVILLALRRLRDANRIPDVPIYVDSPMALEALRIYRQAIRERDPQLRSEVVADGDPFDITNLHELRSVEESKSMNDPRWPSIIVSASGMVSGGRVLHHLAGLLPRQENSVILAGYQAIGTRGRDLLDGAPSIKIHGRYVPVRAEIIDVPTFSVHADASEIVAWLKQAPEAPETCYIVHGEPRAASALRDRIHRELGWLAVVPSLGERVSLD
jgi:metallo-beta-lactamase family protein